MFRSKLVALAVVALAILSGCGGDDDDDESAGSSTTYGRQEFLDKWEERGNDPDVGECLATEIFGDEDSLPFDSADEIAAFNDASSAAAETCGTEIADEILGEEEVTDDAGEEEEPVEEEE